MHERHHWRQDDTGHHARRTRARHVSDANYEDDDAYYADDEPYADDHHDDNNHDHSDGRHRDWADKTADEVKSWFGNERAEHRRDMDRAREGRRERARHERTHHHRRDFRGVGPLTRHDEDEELRDMICRRLSDDPDLDASGILVRVIDNEAILDGAVDSQSAADRASELALDVPGIVHVRDRLEPRPHGRDHDRVRRATVGMGYDESPRRGRRDS